MQERNRIEIASGRSGGFKAKDFRITPPTAIEDRLSFEEYHRLSVDLGADVIVQIQTPRGQLCEFIPRRLLGGYVLKGYSLYREGVKPRLN